MSLRLSPHRLAIRKPDEGPLSGAVSRTSSPCQTLMRMDGRFPSWDWKKAWNYRRGEVSSPENGRTATRMGRK